MKYVRALSVVVALQSPAAIYAKSPKKGTRKQASHKHKPLRGGKKCSTFLEDIPIDTEEDFGEPDWLKVIEIAFPPWEVDGPCAALDEVASTLATEAPSVVGSTDGKFNPCYYTKRFAGLNPDLGGYPTPIDTHYPYEFAAPFMGQPGDGSVKHCPLDSDPNIAIGSCPKLGTTCGKDCAVISDDYGIGHIPPFVPLSALKQAYNSCEYDICNDWFDYNTNGCNIKKSVLDEVVYKYFGDEDTIKFRPPILLDGVPSDTYFKLEYIADPSAGPNSVSRGPHYCSKEVADEDLAWGDFCPYIHTGKNTGKYRHPHLALAAFELWIANQCMADKCSPTWLDSPNGEGYAEETLKTTSITWCEMVDNNDSMSQPKTPYEWPIQGGAVPGLEYYENKTIKPVKGQYVTELVSATKD